MALKAAPDICRVSQPAAFHGLAIEQSGSYIADMVVSQRGNLAMRQLFN